ncbi:MAG: flagellar hook-basal body protein [Bdellovibrionota bacterium]
MGSPSGLWTAVSGGMAQSQNLDIIANNLANANTTGFKKDSATFKEYLTAVERPEAVSNAIPRTVFKDSDFYHFDGKEHAFVNVDRVHTDHSQGNLRPTHGPLDLAIDGPGFFAVKTPSGLMFTRAGDFKVNAEGTIVTTEGYPVMALSAEAAAAKTAAREAQALGENQPEQAPGAGARNPASLNPFTEPALQATVGQQQPPGAQPLLIPVSVRDRISNGEKIHITSEGEIYAGTDQVATLAVAEFADLHRLKKITSGLYANPDNTNVPRIATSSNVRQGFLETSNVNPVSELVELLKSNRMYESNMRAIKAYNDMAGKEANEVGKL